MSRFYANIKGCRGEATRTGTPKSGIEGHIRGFNIGGEVWMSEKEQGSKDDKIYFRITGGSNNGLLRCPNITITADESGYYRITIDGETIAEKLGKDN